MKISDKSPFCVSIQDGNSLIKISDRFNICNLKKNKKAYRKKINFNMITFILENEKL